MSGQNSQPRSKADIARENGRKSLGATTPEGKQRAATASLVHGLTSKSVVLANECPHKYEKLRRSFFDEWQPQGITEEAYVAQMANAYWRLCRIWAIETGLLDSAVFGKREEFENGYSTFTGGLRASDAVGGLNLANRVNIETIQRYERMYERSYDRAATNLCRLRKLRGLKNSPDPLRKPPCPPSNLPDSTVSEPAQPAPPQPESPEHRREPNPVEPQAPAPSPQPATNNPPLAPALNTLRSKVRSLATQALAALSSIHTLLAVLANFLQSAKTQTATAKQSKPTHNPAEKNSQRTPICEASQPDIQLEPASHGPFCPEDPRLDPPLSMHDFYDRYSGTFSYPERFNYTMIYTPNPIYSITCELGDDE